MNRRRQTNRIVRTFGAPASNAAERLGGVAPPLWVVTAGKAQVHLFGQAPWGVRESDRWFAGAPDAAFESSREFWCEVPDDPRLTDGELVLRFGLSGTPLSASIGDTALVRLREAAHVVNVDVASLETCRPW